MKAMRAYARCSSCFYAKIRSEGQRGRGDAAPGGMILVKRQAKSAALPDANGQGGFRDHLRSVTLADVLDVRVVGLALTLAWQFVTFFSASIHFSTRNDVTHFNSVVGFSSLGMIAVFLFAAALPDLFARVMARPGLRWLSPAAMALSTGVLAIVDTGAFFTQPWCSIASTIAGAGLGVLYLGWGDVTHRLTGVQVTAKTAASFLLAALLFALVVMLPKVLAVGATVLLPLVAGGILFQRLGVWQKVEAVDRPTLTNGAFSIRAVLSLGVLALAGSFARALLLDASPIIGDGTYPWLFLMAALVSVGIICGPLLSAHALDFAAAYKTTVFVLGFIFLLVPLTDSGSLVADVLGIVTFCVTLLLVWVVLARITGLYGLSPLFTFGIGWASYTAGMLAGTFVGALVTSYLDITPRLLSAATLVCVCLIFFAYLFLFTEKTVARLLGGPSVSPRRPFRERCLEVASEFGLTVREEEIMELVAKGRSTPRIREELGLTAGTVNSHLSHLYKKLDVHDRQEIIDLIEEGRSSS